MYRRQIDAARGAATLAPAPRIRAISRAAHGNHQQSSYNSPMFIAHDDDIGARD